jgi:hypothetical protein
MFLLLACDHHMQATVARGVSRRPAKRVFEKRIHGDT